MILLIVQLDFFSGAVRSFDHCTTFSMTRGIPDLIVGPLSDRSVQVCDFTIELLPHYSSFEARLDCACHIYIEAIEVCVSLPYRALLTATRSSAMLFTEGPSLKSYIRPRITRESDRVDSRKRARETLQEFGLNPNDRTFLNDLQDIFHTPLLLSKRDNEDNIIGAREFTVTHGGRSFKVATSCDFTAKLDRGSYDGENELFVLRDDF